MEAVRKGQGLPDGAEDEMKAAGVPEWYIGLARKSNTSSRRRTQRRML